MLRTLLLGFFLAVASNAAIANGDAIAQEQAQKQATVKVEMMVVHAHTKNNKVDKSLQSIKNYFRNYKFTGFNLLKKKQAMIPDKKSKSFIIVGNRRVSVRVISHDNNKARLRVTITGRKNRKLLDTTMVVKRNGTFIVAGPQHDNGILILPLKVKY
jgi:hypothetical protein